jgi:hypothetical protein
MTAEIRVDRITSRTGINTLSFSDNGFSFISNTGIGTTNPTSKLTVLGNVDVTGSVGIGTTNPTSKLTVLGNVNITGVVTATSFSGNAIVNSGVTTVAAGTTALPSISPTGDSNTGIFFPSADTIAFAEGGAEAARFDSSGRLLVGTSSALATYLSQVGQVQFAQTNTVPITSVFRFTNDAGGPNFYFNKSRSSSLGANTIVQNADSLGALYFAGADGSSYSAGAAISANVDGTPGANDMPSRLVFSTTADGAASPTERMRIDSAGTTTLTSATSTAPFIAKISSTEVARIDSSGRFGVGTSGPQVLLHASTSSATAYTTSSTGNVLRIENTAAGGFAGLAFVTEPSAGNSGIAAINSFAPSSGDSVLTFSTRQAATLSEKVRIDQLGRLGLGTTNPTDPNGFGNCIDIRSPTGAAIYLRDSDDTVNDAFVIGRDNSDSYLISASGNMLFSNNGSERARIDSSGRLLVGTSTARDKFFGSLATPLQVEGSTTQFCSISITRNDTSADSSKLVLAHARGTSNQILIADDAIGDISWQGADGDKFIQAAHIRAFVDGTPGVDDMPGRLVFSTTADGASTPTERMRISSGGGFKASNYGGYTLTASDDNHEFNKNTPGAAALHVYHTASSGTPYGIYFKFTQLNPNNATSYVFTSVDNTNANIYTIYSNGTVSARSDAKFKKNIETTRNGYLEDLAQLRVVKYNWYNHDDDTPKELGFIAQEVEQVFPGLVSTVPDKDDQGNETGEVSKSIKTSVFTPMLVKALQEALERIETLEAEVAALKAQ